MIISIQFCHFIVYKYAARAFHCHWILKIVNSTVAKNAWENQWFANHCAAPLNGKLLLQGQKLLELVTIEFNLHATASSNSKKKKQRTHMEKCVKIDTHLFDVFFCVGQESRRANSAAFLCRSPFFSSLCNAPMLHSQRFGAHWRPIDKLQMYLLNKQLTIKMIYKHSLIPKENLPIERSHIA